MEVRARLTIRSLFVFSFVFLLFPSLVFAATTPFKSASTVTTDGATPYTNLLSCSLTDGATCDHPLAVRFANLYFRGFGSYADFGMPQDAKITAVRIRVTGKSSNGVYVGLSAGSTFLTNCQFPSDLWATFSSQNITAQTFVAPVTTTFLSGTVNASCLQPYNFNTNNFIWRINYTSAQAWSASIDNFEIAFDYDAPVTPTPTPSPTITPTPTATSTPTPTPSPTPTPTPPGPEPFLDLPWDYKGQGKSFEEEAMNPRSWFDHQYPLQNFCCDPPVLNYTGKTINDFYRSHNGYDYALKNGVELNTPVLAAASGMATFKSEAHSGGAGNVIKIDHGNGYQSWYEHLSIDDLISSDEAKTVHVIKGQKIGKVGMTGNTSGPHIHFSVFKDANNNGNFDDDYPYGVVDPLGWEGNNPDPWPIWTDGNRTGTKSYNLFLVREKPKTTTIPTTGGSITTDKLAITIPDGASSAPLNLIFKNGPFESASQLISSIAPSFYLNAFNDLGESVTQFSKPVEIIYNYSVTDLLNINENTLKLYFLNELTNGWEPLPTLIDTVNKVITSQTTHFSHFALMGEVKDLIPPTTEVIITGEKGQEDWYRSDISVELKGKDNDDGVGLQYTLYTVNGSDWFTYEKPLFFEKEGIYKLTYQSFDKADNKEERKSISFSIDKTRPEARIFVDQEKQDLIVAGIDQNQTNVERLENSATKKKDDAMYVVSDLAGNTIKLDVRERDKDKKDSLKIYAIQYNQDLPIELPDNKLVVAYKGKKEKQDVDEQRFEIKREALIRIIYDSKKNKSMLVVREPKGEKLKELKDGLILLQLYTESGRLKYRY